MTSNSDLSEHFVPSRARPRAAALLLAAALWGCSSADDGKSAASNMNTAGASGAAGAADTSSGGAGAGGSGTDSSGKEPKLPTTTETCPTLATGMVTVLGQQVQLFVGAKQADKKG